jgi:asparagine synthase (glutamine-hydrolysing)
MPWELDSVLDLETVRTGLERLRPLARIGAELEPWPGSAFACVATLESGLYMRHQLLRDTDWASMAHSLEVRVPLVDATLLAGLAGWCDATRGREGKRALAEAPSNPLPPDIAQRPKTGFSTPTAEWIRQRGKGEERGTGGISDPPQAWAREWARVIAERFDVRPAARRVPGRPSSRFAA